MRKIVFIMFATTLLFACSGAGKNDAVPLDETVGDTSVQQLSDSTIIDTEFAEMRTMGKVVATRFADLSFETALPIGQVLVKNGQQVRRGQVLARLDQFKLQNAVEQQQQAIGMAELQMEQARLQMQDVIISQGYDPDKEARIPANVIHNAEVKSGYALAKSQLASAKTQLAATQHELASGVLTAPFDGVVANLSVQAHQLAQPGVAVCRVLAQGGMAVEFRVMESDLYKYKTGKEVDVIPVSDRSVCYKATIDEINPVVDEQGTVTLRAKLSNAQGLFVGMNVEVIGN